MDCFTEEFLNRFIKNSKDKIVQNLQDVEITTDEIALHSDSLCQVLEYSPLIHEKKMNKFKIYRLNDNNRDICLDDKNYSTFSLERKASYSNDELEPEDTLRYNKNSSDRFSLDERGKLKRKSSTIATRCEEVYVKGIINEIIDTIVINKFAEDVVTSHDKSSNTKKRSNIVTQTSQSKESNILTFKINLKFDPEQNTTIMIDVPYNKQLKDLLQKLIDEAKIPCRNLSVFSFTESSENLKCNFVSTTDGIFPSKKDNPTVNNVVVLMQEEIEREIDLDVQLKFLNSKELDLYLKKYPDIPEISSLSYHSQFPKLKEDSFRVNEIFKKVSINYNCDGPIELKLRSSTFNNNQKEMYYTKNNIHALELYQWDKQ